MALNNCLSIALKSMSGLSDPSFIFRKNETYFLDLNADQALSLNKQVEGLDQSSNITTQFLTGINLPDTNQNNYALFRLINPNVVDQNYPPIPVYLKYGSNYYLDADMHIRKYQAGNGLGTGSYEVDFKPITKHWAAGAKDLKLNTLEFDEFTWNDANLLSIIDAGQYDPDTSPGYYFPLAWYGRAYSSGKRDRRPVMQDFRPFFFDTDIIKKGLCALGWQFESPLLEGDYGKGLISYILDKDYLRRPEDLERLKFAANIGDNGFTLPVTDPPTYNKVIFDVEILDNGNNYDPANAVFTGAGIHSFYATMKVQLRYININKWNSYPQNVFEIVLEKASGEILIYDGYDSISPHPPKDGEHSWEDEITLAIADVPVELGDKVYVRYRFWGGTGQFPYNSQRVIEGTFYNTPTSLIIYPGLVSNFSEWIHPDYTLLDFIKGVAHEYNMKFDTDWVNKKVTFYTPYDVKYHGEDLEGFYTDTLAAKDYNLNQLVGSEQLSPYNILSKRYMRLQYADSTDAYIQSKKFADNAPPFSRTLDLGVRYEDTDTEGRPNPFFEPTLNSNENGYSLRYPPEIPILVDNMDGELSWDIGPRHLWTPGKKRTRHPDTTFILYPSAELFPDGAFPIAWQVATVEVEFDTGWAVPNITLAYGTYLYDHYRMFWRRWIMENSVNFQVNADFLLTHPEFTGFSFRPRAVVRVRGRDVVGRVQSIGGWNPCEIGPAQAVLLPERQFSDPCEDLSDDDFDLICKGNLPELLVAISDGNCYAFSLGGTTTSPVSDVTFEYAYADDPTNWTEATSLCPATGPFSVRMIVEFSDSCPDITIVRSFNPCSNLPAFEYTYSDEGDCLAITIVNVGTSTIDWVETEIEVAYSPDGPWSAYTLDTCIPNSGGILYIRATVYFTDGCPPIDLEGQWEFFIEQAICNAIWFFECVVDGEDITFQRYYPYPTGPDGVVQIALDFIKWRYIGEGEEDWKIWDNETPLPCPIEAMRVIIFCDDQCPVYCSDIIICECGDTPPPEETEDREAGCP